MTLKQDLEAMKDREKAATPGPWHRENPDECGQDYISAGEPLSGANDWFSEDYKAIITCDSGVYGPRPPDAEFICSARTDLPALMRMVELLCEAMYGEGCRWDVIEQLWAKAKAGQ